jgi:hypothetical protein
MMHFQTCAYMDLPCCCCCCCCCCCSELLADGIDTSLLLREAGHPSPFTYIIVDRAGEPACGTLWACRVVPPCGLQTKLLLVPSHTLLLCVSPFAVIVSSFEAVIG